MPDQVPTGNSPNVARPLASPSSDAAEATPTQATAYGSDLESLINEAEQAAQPIADADISVPADATLIETPLIDSDGVTHEGRVLTPAPDAEFFKPRFGTLSKTISEMSDPELDTYVGEYRDLVRQAERALDFRRVVLGVSQLEQAQRGDIKRRKLQSDKTKYPVRTITLDKATGKQVKKSASTADLTQMMQMLDALRKLKEKKAVTPTTPVPAKENVDVKS